MMRIQFIFFYITALRFYFLDTFLETTGEMQTAALPFGAEKGHFVLSLRFCTFFLPHRTDFIAIAEDELGTQHL